MKKKLDLKNPRTLNEKIMWLKLHSYSNNPMVTQCADKLRVRDYVKAAGFAHILVPLFQVWDDARAIDWETLPDSFAMKCNHGSAYNIFCPDKAKLDREGAKKRLARWLRTKFWLYRAEIHYRHIQPRILCEQLLADESGASPIDYKVYCFNGLAKFILVCTGRSDNNTKFYFFDERWELNRINPDSLGAETDFTLPRPAPFEEMIRIATVLSKPFPFVRVDFYVVNDRLYFSEMTFTPAAGLDSKRLPATDLMFGDMLDLHYRAVSL